MNSYRLMPYRWRYRGQTGTAKQYFTSHAVLRYMLNFWNSSGEWTYWESVQDRTDNAATSLVPLPYLCVGWMHDQNHYTFNTEKPRWVYA